MAAHDELLKFVNDLIAEGESVIATQHHIAISSFETTPFVEIRVFRKWSTSAQHLLEMLGGLGVAWSNQITTEQTSYLSVALGIQGALESIRENLEAGRLVKFEELVNADTFANLLEQAEHLLTNHYFLAAGVLCRAVLEERLRNICSRENVTPSKPRPTINDFAQSLYAAKAIDKITLKNIESMAATGNAAAHNDPTLNEASVKQLYGNLNAFLLRFSL